MQKPEHGEFEYARPVTAHDYPGLLPVCPGSTIRVARTQGAIPMYRTDTSQRYGQRDHRATRRSPAVPLGGWLAGTGPGLGSRRRGDRVVLCRAWGQSGRWSIMG